MEIKVVGWYKDIPRKVYWVIKIVECIRFWINTVEIQLFDIPRNVRGNDITGGGCSYYFHCC